MFGFVTTEQGRSHFFTNADLQVPAVWEVLGEFGLRVGVFNVPLTYPVNSVDGFMVAGEIGAPGFSEKIFYPTELFREAKQVVSAYPLDHPKAGLPPRTREKLWRELVEARHRLCLHLVRRYPVDVLIVVVNYVDHAQHDHLLSRRVAGIHDLVAWTYQQADTLLGELLNCGDGDVPLVILSDHGAQPVKGYMDVAAFLHRHGWLSYQESLKRGSFETMVYRAAARIYDGLLSQRLPRAFQRFLVRTAKKVKSGTLIDWEKTQAFFDASYGVVVNSPGRSVAPAVKEEDRRAVARDIIAALKELVNPFTGKMDIQAFEAEELYEGPALRWAPDVVVMPQEFALIAIAGPPWSEQMFYTREELQQAGAFGRVLKEGTHRLEGVLVISPPLSCQPENPTVMDVAPTVLSLLGLPVPAYMDGKDLTGTARRSADLGQESVLQQQAKTGPQQVYSEEEEAAVEKRLRELGYL
jgi:predicted AlkP superfamily phosphohydrolase/phosphomutase